MEGKILIGICWSTDARATARARNLIAHSTDRVLTKTMGKTEWRVATDASTGRNYYFHRMTKATSWQMPEEYRLALREAEGEVTARAAQGELVAQPAAVTEATAGARGLETPGPATAVAKAEPALPVGSLGPSKTNMPQGPNLQTAELLRLRAEVARLGGVGAGAGDAPGPGIGPGLETRMMAPQMALASSGRI